jgi:hypothetical protein
MVMARVGYALCATALVGDRPLMPAIKLKTAKLARTVLRFKIVSWVSALLSADYRVN